MYNILSKKNIWQHNPKKKVLKHPSLRTMISPIFGALGLRKDAWRLGAESKSWVKKLSPGRRCLVDGETKHGLMVIKPPIMGISPTKMEI